MPPKRKAPVRKPKPVPPPIDPATIKFPTATKLVPEKGMTPRTYIHYEREAWARMVAKLHSAQAGFYTPMPVEFQAPDGHPVYNAVPANAPLKIRDNKKRVDIPFDDPRKEDPNAKVIFPKAPPARAKELLPYFIVREKGRSMTASIRRWHRRHVDGRLKAFHADADRIQLDVDIESLASRGPKVGLAEAEAAALKLATDDSIPVHGTSCVFTDKNGKPIIRYLAVDPRAVKRLRTEFPNLSDEELWEKARALDAVHTPMRPEALRDFAVKSERLVSGLELPVKKNINVSSRHGPSNVMGPNDGQRPSHYTSYELSDDMIQELKEIQAKVNTTNTPAPKFETKFRNGVATLHYLTAWRQQGHCSKLDLTESAEMLGNGGTHRAQMIKAYFRSTVVQREIISRTAKSLLPAEQFDRLQRAYEAADASNGTLPGPFQAQVTVFKCLSKTHRDVMDGPKGTCLTFSSGNFTGGILCFPDLGLKLRYYPGDMVAFNSCDLYHYVTPWKAPKMKMTDFITPGRIAFVFFSPAATVRDLENKPPGWLPNTACGLFEQKGMDGAISDSDSDSESVDDALFEQEHICEDSDDGDDLNSEDVSDEDESSNYDSE